MPPTAVAIPEVFDLRPAPFELAPRPTADDFARQLIGMGAAIPAPGVVAQLVNPITEQLPNGDVVLKRKRRGSVLDDVAEVKAGSDRAKTPVLARADLPDVVARSVDAYLSADAQAKNAKADMETCGAVIGEFAEAWLLSQSQARKLVIGSVVLHADTGKAQCSVKNQYVPVKESYDKSGALMCGIDTLLDRAEAVVGDTLDDLFIVRESVELADEAKADEAFLLALRDVAQKFPKGYLKVTRALAPTQGYHQRRMTDPDFQPVHTALVQQHNLVSPFKCTVTPGK